MARDETGERRVPLNTLASKAAGDPGDPPTVPATSLLDAYTRWRASQAAVVAKASAKPAEDDEAKALRKSRKRLRKLTAEGISPARAAVLAHVHYRNKGGRSGISVWSKKVAEGK